MQKTKSGYIVKILRQDNVGIIREEQTLTEWLYFLDESREKLQVGTAVVFERDRDYEQPVAMQIKRVDPYKSKWAV